MRFLQVWTSVFRRPLTAELTAAATWDQLCCRRLPRLRARCWDPHASMREKVACSAQQSGRRTGEGRDVIGWGRGCRSAGDREVVSMENLPAR